jgi:xanthine dehydrogenase accessory factor
MGRLVQTICNLMEQGEDLVLATILSHEGSTPRTAGTKMIIRSSGDHIATVGGGLVEAEVVKYADEVFESRKSHIKAFDLTGADVERMDLVCGGHLEILVEFVPACPENLLVFRELAKTVKEGKKSYLVAHLGRSGEAATTVERCLIRQDGSVCGSLVCPSRLMDALGLWSGKERYPVVLTIDDHRYIVEPSFAPGSVYLFGAGHVSQQVAPLARLVDFRTVILDDRSEYANRDRFPASDVVTAIDSFDHAFSGLDIDEDSYLVIVTRGHMHDKTVLEQALKTNARYIGMIGSRKKRDKIYGELLNAGFTEQDLGRVHSPIGTAIGAETPEEIGISIVGELIEARARRNQ